MNFFVFAGIGIVLHLLVVLAVYFFLRKVFKDHGMISFMLALLFGVLGAQFQAVSWVVADISTLTASFFGVVASVFGVVFVMFTIKPSLPARGIVGFGERFHF